MSNETLRVAGNKIEYSLIEKSTYEKVFYTFRLQGPLNEEKTLILAQLQKVLNISEEQKKEIELEIQEKEILIEEEDVIDEK